MEESPTAVGIPPDTSSGGGGPKVPSNNRETERMEEQKGFGGKVMGQNEREREVAEYGKKVERERF